MDKPATGEWFTRPPADRATAPDATSQTQTGSPVDVLSQIFTECSRDLRLYLLGLLRHTEDAEEATQLTFQRLIEHQNELNLTDCRAWLFTVAFHEAMLIRRKRGVQQRGRQHWAEGLTSSTEAASVANPLQSLISREDVQRLRAAISTLPENQRVVVEERLTTERTFAEIATSQGLPLGTVLTRMRLAMQLLKSRLVTNTQTAPTNPAQLTNPARTTSSQQTNSAQRAAPPVSEPKAPS